MQTDSVGNLTSVTPPDAGTHRFSYDKANQATAYSPPSLAGIADETATFDLDGLVTRAGHSDSTEAVVTREPSGRVKQVSTPWWVNELTYTATTGQVASLTRGTQRLEWQYDGFLMKEEKAIGVAPATSQWTWDSDFRVASHSINGAAVSYAYDADSLLTQAGAATLGRMPSTGQLTSVMVGNVTTAVTLNQYGELATLTSTANSAPLYSEGLSYDAAGRISIVEEIVQGTPVQWVYGYDKLGQLTGELEAGDRGPIEKLRELRGDVVNARTVGAKITLFMSGRTGSLSATLLHEYFHHINQKDAVRESFSDNEPDAPTTIIEDDWNDAAHSIGRHYRASDNNSGPGCECVP